MDQPGETSSTWHYYSIHSIPRPLDIVWCHFPEFQHDPSKPGPKPRPALVRAVRLNSERTRAEVEVTYGTSRTKSFERPYDLIIANAEDRIAMGLPQATRFDLDLTIWLPWAEEWFKSRSHGQSAVIGSLTPKYRQMLAELTGRRAQRPARN
jgi:hypothetical protein